MLYGEVTVSVCGPVLESSSGYPVEVYSHVTLKDSTGGTDTGEDHETSMPLSPLWVKDSPVTAPGSSVVDTWRVR
jgi:hypothetical protein